ncbi:MAG: NADH-quinone oxidoreductase subunit I, partial [Chloroflexi bacterium]|nr:NADH-quinone oxidoreductase subunit I [Chloroflexota bacterium]
MNVIKGFQTTAKHLMEEAVTIQYPEQVQQFHQRYKGHTHLRRYASGLEQPIASHLLDARHPAHATWHAA